MDTFFLTRTGLFQGISEHEITAILDCVQAVQKSYAKNDVVYHAGTVIHSLGIVLSGSVFIENDDFWGNKNVLDIVSPGEVFAEAYASIPDEPLMLQVVACETTEILFLNVQRLLAVCHHACTYHHKLIENLLRISAQKNLHLSRRSLHTASKTIRGRLLSYLSYQAIRQGSRDFVIPFNRQQLADYLNVDRSALSNELSKMQKEGILRADKSHFHLSSDDMELYL